jgi:hypothetical protein
MCDLFFVLCLCTEVLFLSFLMYYLSVLGELPVEIYLFAVFRIHVVFISCSLLSPILGSAYTVISETRCSNVLTMTYS